jgi:hypothetical protein
MKLACAVLFLSLVACRTPEPRSAVIDKLERAGSGDLSNVSTGSIHEWLGKHKDLAYQVDAVCKPIRASAPAQWSDSTEGKLCRVAGEFALMRGGPVRSDGKRYLPGLK